MPRQCHACHHPKRDEINALIIEGRVPLRKIAEDYHTPEHPLSYSGLRWHKKKHLAPILKQVTRERIENTKNIAHKSLDVLDAIINQYPNALDTTTVSAVIKAIELKARMTGELQPEPVQIMIEWGLGLDKERLKRIDARYKILEPKDADQDDEDALPYLPEPEPDEDEPWP